ncbi:hypothetical protein D3Q16_26755 [Salmonella enterica]|nr:hypothetical protein [Salmonella enterica]
MKRYLFVALIISILSGCQSYAALQAGCVQGNVEACNTLAQRNMMIGNAQAGLNGYNAQRLTEAQINALNAVSVASPTGINAQANYYQQPIVTSRGQPTRCYQNPDHSVTCNTL